MLICLSLKKSMTFTSSELMVSISMAIIDAYSIHSNIISIESQNLYRKSNVAPFEDFLLKRIDYN